MLTKAEILKKHYGVDNGKVSSSQLDRETIDYYYNPPPLDHLTDFKLPYVASTDRELPSIDRITSECGKRPLGGRFSKVFEIDGYAVKRGGLSVVLEAENMIFLEKHSQINTAKLYAVYCQPMFFEAILDTPIGEVPVYYAVMELIEGKQLFVMDNDFNATEEAAILAKLGEQLQLLRSVPPPDEFYYGRVNGKGLLASISAFKCPGTKIYGPYNTYKDIFQAINTAAQIGLCLYTSDSPGDPQVEMNWRTEFESVLSKSTATQPVLTHIDPHYGNFIIQRPTSGGNVDDFKVVLIDWEALGWLPEYFQSAAIIGQYRKEKCDQITSSFNDTQRYEKEIDIFVRGKSTLDFEFGN